MLSQIINLEFASEEVKKLLIKRAIREVDESELLCINPLSVASNKEGKKCLVIDLSWHVNKFCKAKRFRIESVQDFAKLVKQGDWLYAFDLKSAYHHIYIYVRQAQEVLGVQAQGRWQGEVLHH